MQRTYNQFTSWVAQDDFLTGWPWFIEHKNIDGLRDGYGVTLWPKMNKQLLTDEAIFGIDFLQQSGTPFEFTLIGWEDGKLYYLDSTDNTPEHTLLSSNGLTAHIVSIRLRYVMFSNIT